MKDFFNDLNNELWVEPKVMVKDSLSDESDDVTTFEETKPEAKQLDYREYQSPNMLKENLMTSFPQTNFYLPHLRDKSTRIIPVGWNNEIGKNMIAIQFSDEILLVNAWLQLPENGMLWAKYSVPDASFIIPAKNKIKWLILTSSHVFDVWGVKQILEAMPNLDVYASKYTARTVEKIILDENIRHSWKIVIVDKQAEIGKFKIELFKLNWVIPENYWVYIENPETKIVYANNYKIDFSRSLEAPADLNKIAEIWSRGIQILISDASASFNEGFSTSEKDICKSFEEDVENKFGKVFFFVNPSQISRIVWIIRAAEKAGKQVFLLWKEVNEAVKIAEEFGFISANSYKKLNQNATKNINANKQIIISSGKLSDESGNLHRLSEWNNNIIEIEKWDKFILPKSEVETKDKDNVTTINKLIKRGSYIRPNKYLDINEQAHANIEEQKLMFSLISAKYIMPVNGDLFLRSGQKNNAIKSGIQGDKIVLNDNGEIVDIDADSNIFKSKIKAPIQDIIVDGHGMWIAGSHVIRARKRMMNSGVLVVVFTVDEKTRTIVWPIRLETRGLVYLDEVRQIHRVMIKKTRAIYENTIMDVPEIEDKDLIKIIKTDLESYILKAIDREPMIIPIIVNV